MQRYSAVDIGCTNVTTFRQCSFENIDFATDGCLMDAVPAVDGICIVEVDPVCTVQVLLCFGRGRIDRIEEYPADPLLSFVWRGRSLDPLFYYGYVSGVNGMNNL